MRVVSEAAAAPPSGRRRTSGWVVPATGARSHRRAPRLGTCGNRAGPRAPVTLAHVGKGVGRTIWIPLYWYITT
jgi:hypothetical protein